MADAPDFGELTELDQPKLASIYTERSAYAVMAASRKPA